MSKHQTKSQRRASKARHAARAYDFEHRCTVCGASEKAVWLVRYGISGEQCPPCGAKVEAILAAFDREWDDALSRRESRGVLAVIEDQKNARIGALHQTRGVES